VLKRFDSAKVKRDTFASPLLPSGSFAYSTTGPEAVTKEATTCAKGEGSALAHHRHLSVAVKDCGISTLPHATLDAMWNKAEEYLLSSSDIQTAPGNDRKSKMVTSRSGGTPHFVRVVSPGHYVCDKSCLQWSSSQICSHTLAAAEVNGELISFIQWYTVTGQEPNITRLAQAGLPAGRGRKGGVPKRKRSRTPSVPPDIVVPRPAASHTKSRSQLLSTNSSQSGIRHCSTSMSHLQAAGHFQSTSQANHQPTSPTDHSQYAGHWPTTPFQSASCIQLTRPASIPSTVQTLNSQLKQSVTCSTACASPLNVQTQVLTASPTQSLVLQGQQVLVHSPVSSLGNVLPSAGYD